MTENSIKITINPLLNQPYTSDVWPIKDEEPPRVSVEFNKFYYSLVLSDKPALEIYNTKIDPVSGRDGLGDLLKTYDLVGISDFFSPLLEEKPKGHYDKNGKWIAEQYDLGLDETKE